MLTSLRHVQNFKHGHLVVLLFCLTILTACNLRSPEQEEVLLTQEANLIAGTPAAALQTEPEEQPFTDPVAGKVREIFGHGQRLGNRPNVFSKIGDSITVSTNFLAPIGDNLYNLGDFEYLQQVVDRFSGSQLRTGDSFRNTSLAATVGWSADSVLNPNRADRSFCESGESPLVCEFRVNRPSIALIFFGTNDAGYRSAEEFRADMEEIVRVSEEMGVIPVISTVPYRLGFESAVDRLNEVIFDIAEGYSLPVWDYAAMMSALPNGGLSSDNIHPSIGPGGYSSAVDFSLDNLRYGYVMRNLTALQMLDKVLQYIG
jgi:hypothetical protein